jgi:hypothetical protein
MKARVTCDHKYGQFTRTTERPYTHVVVACGRDEEWLKGVHERSVRDNQAQLERYQRLSDDPTFVDDYKSHYRAWAQSLREWLATAPGKHAEKLEANRKAIAGNHGQALSWHMSEAAARKAAANYQQREGWCGVEIAPVRRA